MEVVFVSFHRRTDCPGGVTLPPRLCLPDERVRFRWFKKETGLESVGTEADPRRRKPSVEHTQMRGVFPLKLKVNHPS
jgi:hypothetical protein